MPQHSCLQCRLRPITSSKKIPRYSAKLARQMAHRFIALYGFYGVLVHGIVKQVFLRSMASNALINMISIHSWCEREDDGGLLRDSAQASFNVFFQPIKEECILEQLIYVAAATQHQISSSLLLTPVNKRTTFFQWRECFLDFLFYSRNYAWNLGVWLIHKYSLYTSLYGTYF